MEELYGPGSDDYGRSKIADLSNIPAINIPAISVPPTEPVPSTGPLITDHVYAGGSYGPFSVCTYCNGHHAKHLYQSSAYVYHSAPYQPSPWYTTPYTIPCTIPTYQPSWVGDYPYAQPTVTYTVCSYDANGRPTTTDSCEGTSLST